MYYSAYNVASSVEEMVVLDKVNNLDVDVCFYGWYDWSNLTSIRLLSEEPQTVFGYENINHINTVFIPTGTLEAYSNAEGWSDWLNASVEHQFVEYDVEEYLANMPAPAEVLQFSFEYDGSDITASFEDGMTWAEWSGSDYSFNTNIYSYSDGNGGGSHGYMTYSSYWYLLLNNEYVRSNDVMSAGTYTLTTTAPVVAEPEE